MKALSNRSCRDCARIRQLEQNHQMTISKISHEIRNPLTLIYSSLQLIETECPSVRSSDLWEQLKKDVRDTIALLKELTSAGASIQTAPVNAAAFFNGLASSFSSIAKAHAILFHVDIAPALDGLLCELDSLRLREALTNLLLNACDALENTPSAQEGLIQLHADVQNGCLRIHIRDNGPGIPPAYLDSLFEPFVTHKKNGTGLGLGIAKSIAQKHGGTLTVDTCCESPSTYTDFCLELPIADCASVLNNP